MKTTHRIAAASLLLFNRRASAPVNSVLPSVSGTTNVGETLTGTPGTWSGSPVLTYQWRRDGADIAGETGLTYLLADADFGTMIDWLETPDGNAAAAVASAAVGPVAYASYEAKLLARRSTGLIAYWPLDELSGTNADNAQGAARDGTYSGVALDNADGAGATMGRAGLWDGVNDLCNIYTVSLRDAFNGAEGTLSIWAKISASGVWTDGTEDRIVTLTADGNNSIALRKTSGSNTLNALYAAGGTFEQISVGSQTSTGWMHLAITWSKADDQVKFYINGAQAGSTATTLGTFAGTLNAATTVIGASVTTPLLVWSGNLQHAAIWTTPLTLAQIQELAEAF
jgi:hypothetical protein